MAFQYNDDIPADKMRKALIRYQFKRDRKNYEKGIVFGYCRVILDEMKISYSSDLLDLCNNVYFIMYLATERMDIQTTLTRNIVPKYIYKLEEIITVDKQKYKLIALALHYQSNSCNFTHESN